MLGYLFDVGNHGVSLFIFIFLAETEAKVQEKEDLDEVIKNIQHQPLRQTKS